MKKTGKASITGKKKKMQIQLMKNEKQLKIEDY